MVRVKQFNVVTDKPIKGNNPKRVPSKKKKKKGKKKKKREEWEEEEEEIDVTTTSDDWTKSKKEEDWKPSGDIKASGTKKSARKRRKTKKPGFPQVHDLVAIDFGKERFEAIVTEAGDTLLDIMYTVDGSSEYIDRKDMIPRNMELLKRPEVGSKIKKKFKVPGSKSMKAFSGRVTKIHQTDEDTLYMVKYEDGDDETLEIGELIKLMI